MKLIICFCTFLSGVLPAVVQQTLPHAKPQKVTELKISESSFAQERHYIVTVDSLLVNFTMNAETGPIHSHFARFLSKIERDNLLSSFDKMYLSELKSYYEGHTDVDHDWTYGISINKNNFIKSTTLFKYKLQPFYVFCKKLNVLLPTSFRISYNDSYLKE